MHYLNAIFPLPLNLGFEEFRGLSIEAGVIVPSLEPMAELVIVPFREETTEPPFIDR
jgi:hypothetical protein